MKHIAQHMTHVAPRYRRKRQTGAITMAELAADGAEFNPTVQVTCSRDDPRSPQDMAVHGAEDYAWRRRMSRLSEGFNHE